MRTGFTDYLDRLSVSPGVLLLVRSACRALQILSLFLLGWLAPGTVAYITCSAAIQPARGIHLAPRLVHPIVRHMRLAPKAFDIAHPRFRASKAYAWYSTAP